MSVRLRRNDPCWCGSGKKFKKCHMLREQMDRPQLHEMIDLYRELTATKYCSHPVRSECEGQIVKAHTVPKSGSLRRIAKEGHVYQFRADLPLLKQTQGSREKNSLASTRRRRLRDSVHFTTTKCSRQLRHNHFKQARSTHS